MIILFLALSFIPQTIAQLDHLNTRTCGLTRLPEGFETGEENVQSANIFHGQRAEHGEMPWVVLIRASSSRTAKVASNHRCTGTIIGYTWVITAAHCIVGLEDGVVNNFNLEINAGSQRMSSNLTGEWIHNFPFRRAATSVHHYYPEEYDYEEYVYDIALIHLSVPLIFYYDVNTRQFLINSICLPTGEPDMSGLYTVAGYGHFGSDWTSDDSINYPPDLMMFTTQIHTAHDCELNISDTILVDFARQFTGDEEFVLTESISEAVEDNERLICVAASDYTTTCEGDSGGPLSIQTYDPNTGWWHWQLTGVLSGGQIIDQEVFEDLVGRFLPDNEEIELEELLYKEYRRRWPCDHITFYNKVHAHRHWIQETLEQHQVGAGGDGILAVGALVTGLVITTYVKKALGETMPALESDVESGHSDEPEEPERKKMKKANEEEEKESSEEEELR